MVVKVRSFVAPASATVISAVVIPAKRTSRGVQSVADTGSFEGRPDVPVPSSTAAIPSAVAIIVPPSPTPVVVPPRLIPVASSRRFVVSRRATVAIVAGGSDGREGHHQLFCREYEPLKKGQAGGNDSLVTSRRAAVLSVVAAERPSASFWVSVDGEEREEEQTGQFNLDVPDNVTLFGEPACGSPGRQSDLSRSCHLAGISSSSLFLNGKPSRARPARPAQPGLTSSPRIFCRSSRLLSCPSWKD